MYLARPATWLLLWFLWTPATLSADEGDVQHRQERVVQTALDYIGTRFLWGGNTAQGIDCSGLMVQSFQAIGVALPRHSGDQAQQGYRVAKEDLQRGDMVFFARNGKVFHVGLVMRVEGEEVWFIHASSSRGVIVSRLSDAAWRRRYQVARRMWPVLSLPDRPNLGLAHQSALISGGAPAYLSLPPLVASERRLSRAEVFAIGPRNRRKIQADILARYGYQFPQHPEILAHYQQFDWYQNQLRIDQPAIVFELLSSVEIANLRLLAEFDRL
jgi:hypothetical protein